MIDGVYSMYGQFAPIHSLIDLLNKYKKFHLYADDAHGFGWTGKNGRGYILSQVDLHPKMILATSLNKAFAAGGGAFVFYDEELCEKVKTCGGAFIFSGPHQIPVLGAGIASAKIYLSEEINYRQQVLKEKISYCQRLLEQYQLPVVSNPLTPIFFIGLGLVRVGYNMAERIMKDGFYVNISVFPAVPETCTGLRFTITMHHSFDDIKNLVECIARHYLQALEEENRTFDDVVRAFRKVATFKIPINTLPIKNPKNEYLLQAERTIAAIPEKLWNSLMAGKGAFDWNALAVLEKTFTDNDKKENNWEFYYYIVRDNQNNPVLASFFTLTWVKDDMLASAAVSKKIEKERKSDPYYLSSRTFLMGTLMTEGNHLFLDRNRADWKDILMFFLDHIWKEQERLNAEVLNLRDFEKGDEELCDFFRNQGFIKIDLPPTHILEDTILNVDEYLSNLKHENRYYVKKKAINCESHFDVSVKNTVTTEEVVHYFNLYKKVADKSFELKAFDLPEKLFFNITQNKNWEVIELNLSPDLDARKERQPVGVALNYLSQDTYCFVLTGMDYEFVEKYNVYPQILWQIVLRAKQLGYKKISFGFTASQNKRKFGAEIQNRVAFLQLKDNFNISLLDLLSHKVEA